MATSKQKIRICVSKLETDTGEILVARSNFWKEDYYCPHYDGVFGVGIDPSGSDEAVVEVIKNYMIRVFRGIESHLEKNSVKFDVQYFFNKEYSAKGQLLYYHHDTGNDKKERHFHQMFWAHLKKPLTDREISLFIKALREIPSFEK